MIKNLTKIAALIAACACISSASASVINLSDPNVVGTIRSGEPSSVANEVVWVNYLLSLGANTSIAVSGTSTVKDGHTFATFANDLNGTVSATGAVTGGVGATSVPAGFDYVLAKYDGPNGGDVVWYIGGAATTLPATSVGLWGPNENNGYGISHFAAFNPSTTNVPDAGSSLLLLGAGVSALGMLRRKLS